MIRPSGRSVLYTLTVALAASGALRIGTGVGLAFAEGAAAEHGTEGSSGPPQSCPAPPIALAEALTARETKVAEREAALDNRMAALALAEALATTRIGELQAAEDSLRETLGQADGAAEDDLLRLTAVYESMKPKDAAALFQAMKPEFAAGFLGRMRPDAAAAILSGMPSEDAYAISVILAGRNADVPTE